MHVAGVWGLGSQWKQLKKGWRIMGGSTDAPCTQKQPIRCFFLKLEVFTWMGARHDDDGGSGGGAAAAKSSGSSEKP